MIKAPLFVLFIFLFLLLGLIACNNSSSPHHRNTFYFNLSGGLESLDPAFAKDLSTMWLAHMIYNTLVETDTNQQLKPSLAKSWAISEDGLRYRFHLRSDVFFQDAPQFKHGRGRKMVADDVVYSLSRIVNPKTASPGSWIFNGRVDSLQPFVAINDTLFEIRLQQPFQPMMHILSMPYCSIVPREVVENLGNKFRSQPCGTGPFQLYLWDEGNQLLLHKNEHYWEKDTQGQTLPYLQAVSISFLDNKGTEFLQFLLQRLDFVNGVDGSFKDLVLTKKGELKEAFDKKYQLSKRPYLNTEYLGFMIDSTLPASNHPVVKNKLIRQAINYAIDRNKIVTYFKNGVGIPATGGFTPPGLPGFEKTPTYGYSFIPQRADSLLAEAGYPKGSGLPPLTIITADNYADIVNFIATQLADVGIRLKVEIMQPGIVRQQMSKSDALFFRAQWIADYTDAETYLAVFYGPFPAPPNYTRFNHAQFDQWYEESMSMPDSSRHIRYRQMDSLAIAQAPLVPLYYDQLLHFLQNNVSGFRATSLNIIELKHVRKR